MPAIKRAGKPMTLGELIARDGGAMLGSQEPCPHCGREPRPYEVVTPKKGWVLLFQIPCSCRSRR